MALVINKPLTININAKDFYILNKTCEIELWGNVSYIKVDNWVKLLLVMASFLVLSLRYRRRGRLYIKEGVKCEDLLATNKNKQSLRDL